MTTNGRVTTNGHFPLRAFFGHHKCATGWIDDILMEVCFHLGISFQIVHRASEFEEYGSLAEFVRQKPIDFLAYTNAKAEHVAGLPIDSGFHVVRDPRDVLVSAYFSHRYSHPVVETFPELAEHRDRLERLSKEEGLFAEMEFSRQEFEDMYRWDYTQDRVLELKMEHLTKHPHSVFPKIMRFLGALDEETAGVQQIAKSANMMVNRWCYTGRRLMPNGAPVPLQRPLQSIPASKLAAIIEQKRFEKMAGGRSRGEENVKSHYRKGEPGDWRNHLTDGHIDRFKQEYNDLLLKLEYETTPDW